MLVPIATVAAALSGAATLSLPPSVKATPTGKASLADGDVRLPVARGELNGIVRLTGGLRLARGGRKVGLDSFELDGKRLTARVDGINRRTVFVLRKPKVAEGPVTTTVRAAVRGTPALTLGMPALRGRLDLKASAKFLQLVGGQSRLQLDQAFRDTLAAEMITPGGGEGSPLGDDGAIAFPVSRGRLATKGLEGTIEQGGGITFSKLNVPAVRLEDYLIDTRADTISGRVNDGEREGLFTSSLPAATIEQDFASFADSAVALNQRAADVLNTAFGSSAFSAGQVLGTLTVRAEVQ